VDLLSRLRWRNVTVVDQLGKPLTIAQVWTRTDQWRCFDVDADGKAQALMPCDVVETWALCRGYRASPLPVGLGDIVWPLLPAPPTSVTVRLPPDVRVPGEPVRLCAQLSPEIGGARGYEDRGSGPPRTTIGLDPLVFGSSRTLRWEVTEDGAYRLMTYLWHTECRSSASTPRVAEDVKVSVRSGVPVDFAIGLDSASLAKATDELLRLCEAK
jgi:hypothetical protein